MNRAKSILSASSAVALAFVLSPHLSALRLSLSQEQSKPIIVSIPFAGSVVANFTLGGTALLIVVSVVVETMKQLEAQLMMRNYEGFIR